MIMSDQRADSSPAQRNQPQPQPQQQQQPRHVARAFPQSRLSTRAWIYMLLLSIQYGAQPLVSKRFTRNHVIVSSIVIACEWAKVVFALIFMAWDGSLWTVGKNWTLSGALVASALPAAMYALQNSLLQLGYRHLDSLTFSMLNQSKLLFTAIFMFLLLGIRQSSHQIGALAVLLGASLLLCLGESSTARKSDGAHVEALLYGVLPTLVASILSGLASSLCQWASQVKRRSSYLMTIEMSTIGTLCLVVSLSWSPDGHTIRKYGFFYGWTIHTLIPVFANAIGGILVGLVTTAAGGVRKGFVIVNALLVTAFLQLMFEGKPPSFYTWSAMPLVVSSVILYQRYPYREKTKSQ